MELNRDEFNWTDKPVIGFALLLKGGSIDSFGNKIDGNVFYEVPPCRRSYAFQLVPTNKNQKHEFINNALKHQNRFN